MKKIVSYGACLFVLWVCRAGFGALTEQIGPDSVIGHPTVAQPDWPIGIEAVPQHPSRVYSVWVNGNENFYFRVTPAEANELVALFSNARMRDHDVLITAAHRPVKTFKGDSIDYNASVQIVAGLVLFMTREREVTDLPREPRLTIYAGADRAILEKITWPKNVTIDSEVPGLSIAGGRTKPQRDIYYGRLAFADGSPPMGFVQGVQSRITLWEQSATEGINVGSVNNEGYFNVLLSVQEIADLRAGRIRLTATVANYLTKPRRTDPRIPVERLTRDKDQARPIPIEIPGYYYGRILFEDGTPPVVDPAPWPGAGIWVSFPFAGHAQLDAEGYFKVLLTKEQLEKLKADKPHDNIYVPDYVKTRTFGARAVYSAGLLSPDKTTAGVVKIPRPKAPKQERATAESRVGKPIPGFEHIRFEEFQQEQAKDKSLLICFWDLEERPSRQCMQTLARQKDDLLKKNTIVLAIHCGTPNEAARDWLRKNGISVAFGMIDGDPHDVLLAWGARGTPWLILTDQRHVVTKEGFSLEQPENR